MKKTSKLKFNPWVPGVLFTSVLFINNAEANLFTEIPEFVTTKTTASFTITVTDPTSALFGETLTSPTLVDPATVFGQQLVDANTFNAAIVNLNLTAAGGYSLVSGDIANTLYPGTGYNTVQTNNNDQQPGDLQFPDEPGSGTIRSNNGNGTFPATGSGFSLSTDITLPTLASGDFLYTEDPISFNALALTTYPWKSTFTNIGNSTILYDANTGNAFGNITLTIAAVPEPEQWMMLLAGFGLLRAYIGRNPLRLQSAAV